jgi:hypothetical protein
MSVTCGGTMRRPILAGCFAGLLFVPLAATADSTTTGGHPACGQRHWLEAAVAFAEEGNDARYERYVDTGRCITTREGMDVEVIARYGDAENDRVEILFRGFRFFTVAEAVASSL